LGYGSLFYDPVERNFICFSSVTQTVVVTSVDLDENLVLANIDLHIPMRSWERSLQRTFDWSAPAGDLAVARGVLDEPEINIPVACTTDPDRRIVHISIGSTPHDRTVALSEKCLALLSGEDLVGFVARDFAEQ
jgi:hypothetical protein